MTRTTALLSINTQRTPSASRFAAVLLAVLIIPACSGGGAGPEPVADPLLLEDQGSSEPLPAVLVSLKADPDLIAPVPEIAYTQTMADSGLQISYTEKSLRVQASPNSIEAQWVFMQNCVQQSGAALLVLVRSGLAEPFTPADDVVRNEQISATEITSVPIASASILHGAVIQVSATDFDGSLGTPLFNLRSIMGRHLWLSANLPERDYPFQCARQQP